LKYGEKVSRIRVYHEEGKDGLKLFYEDDGVGISKAMRQKIFAEGFTAGKGLGHELHLVKKIMEIYG
jgi:signal transduction histidine kinase